MLRIQSLFSLIHSVPSLIRTIFLSWFPGYILPPPSFVVFHSFFFLSPLFILFSSSRVLSKLLNREERKKHFEEKRKTKSPSLILKFWVQYVWTVWREMDSHRMEWREDVEWNATDVCMRERKEKREGRERRMEEWVTGDDSDRVALTGPSWGHLKCQTKESSA